jgi:AraC family transcriptional regulator, ethanolamine operon transcriptional activator
LSVQLIEAAFDDIDAMAASPFAWRQEYHQIGRGKFQGHLTQLVMNSLQLGRVRWSPGVLQRGMAPSDTWVFGLPIRSEGSLHARRRPIRNGELMAATSRDDVGFAASGATDIMVAVLPMRLVEQWMQKRRGAGGLDVHLPLPYLATSPADLTRRAQRLSQLLSLAAHRPASQPSEDAASSLEAGIFDVILDIIPSAEKIEALHYRARVARDVLSLLRESTDRPLTITDLCERTGAKERTLFLSCVEAFGRPPARLLTELRLNGAHRALMNPQHGTSVTQVATAFGFNHFGRFAKTYARQFGELPSATLAKSLGTS